LSRIDGAAEVVELRHTDSMGNRFIVRVDSKDNSVVAYKEGNRNPVSVAKFMSSSGKGREKEQEEFKKAALKSDNPEEVLKNVKQVCNKGKWEIVNR
jgi:uncharacterized UPF0160 family protein